MKKSLLSAVLFMLMSAACFGQELGLEFLSGIPELRELRASVSMAFESDEEEFLCSAVMHSASTACL